MLVGGIEAGGTKFVCAVGDTSGKVVDKICFPTRDPETTLDEVQHFFAKYEISAIGVGSFGPIDLRRDSNTYGTILNTPKTKWKHYDILGRLERDFSVPVFITTDVNAACLGEYKYGAGKDVNSCLYITIGTGIGAGFVHDGIIFQGKNHPEMGHIFVPQHKDDDFKGVCPYHGNCLEGLASGPAIEQRYGKKGHLLSDDQQVWELEAFYIAQAIVNYTVMLSPERIILGGGVMKQERLYELIRKYFMKQMNEYVHVGNIDEFIVAPKLGDHQGIVGAFGLVDGVD
ncbi:ROK family protein [Ornithinibacillus sp. L9]|uniref:fructokinase n=1 Tax=Ornithinibacillus caprae TaxID=2678566 RepID=A0A6N8FE56_9BACI|nr:ROK family protein [Ornithinibacillus caprae]MUK87695.1 ROK family protein [Ornithinibacillus caprae]